MIFRALAVFSHHKESISPTPSPTQDKFFPLRNASNAPMDILAEVEWQPDIPPPDHLSCRHDLSPHPCPHCNYPRTKLTMLDRPSAAPPSIRRRKLRKVKPDYQQLLSKPPTVDKIASPRPESILSTHSRTLLLHPSRTASSYYATRRIPNKLEKRDKMRRMASVATSGFMALGVDNRESSAGSEEISSLQPNRASSNIGTEELVSFAWTGRGQAEMSTSSPSSQNSDNPSFAQPRRLSRTKSDCSTTWRKSILRKPKDVNVQKAIPPPWSLANILSDDKTTDEKLVDQLEDVRAKELSERRCLSVSCLSPTCQAVLNDSYAEFPPEPDEFAPNDLLDSSWNTTGQALLLCREMLRTERRYLSSLKILANGGTATFPPFAMFYYLPRLIMASEEFIQSMTKNPSVRGVSEAFLAVKDKLDEAFIDWCGAVGTFFVDDGASDSKDASDQSVAKLRRSASTPFSDKRNPTLDKLVFNQPQNFRRNKNQPSVRELTILPTQRIVRYVLLFKELSALTSPSFSSSFVVAQALDAAQIIAKHSYEAQAHASLIAPST